MKVANFLPSRVLLVAAALILSSCASSYVYKAAEGPDIATVELRNASGQSLRAMESHKGDCTDMRFFGGLREGLGPGSQGTTTVAPGTFLVINIVGGASLNIGGAGPGTFSGSACSFIVGFVVEPKAAYELTYALSARGCTLHATAHTGEGIKRVALTKMDLKNLIGPQSCARAAP